MAARTIFRRIIIGLTVLILVTGFPLAAWADDPASSPASATGPNAPQGPEASTYTYNSTTGMWENDYYIWNPTTGQTTPKTPQTYSYNPATGRWDTTDWVYDVTQAKYVPNVVSVAAPPDGAPTDGGPITPAAAGAVTQGPDSPVTTTGGGTGLFDNFYNASISNNLTQNAASGNTAVSLNTTAGDAVSGKAVDMATILNILRSSTALQGGNLTTFTQNVGDWTGDLVIDPSQLSGLGQVSTANNPSNLTINTNGTGQINNNIDMSAASGNAAVDQNTTAGNAVTGDAAAIANIVNVINSIIGAGQSFIGTININGNLDGDILLPPDTLNALLAAGASTSGPNSPTAATGGNTLNATLSDTSSINNTLNLSAASGNADVSNNTSAGNAATGDASTNIQVLNLTGKQVVGADALLVFVNVMGKWVGMIVNAPSGATSAGLCNCTSGPNSPANTSGNTNTNINSTTNNGINNNVNLSAKSGNASVTNNTTAGNAATGNALASVNLLNISTSSLNLSNWLGVLFINVFGSWNGSFGIDTSAGNKPSAETGGQGGGPTIAEAVKSVKVFSFVPRGGSGGSYSLTPVVTANNPTSGSNNQPSGTVLAATTVKPPKAGTGVAATHNSVLWTAGSLFLLAGIVGAEELIAARKEGQAKLRRYLHSITVQPFKQY